MDRTGRTGTREQVAPRSRIRADDHDYAMMRIMEPTWLRWVASGIAALLVLFLLIGPLSILYKNQRPPTMPQQHRLGLNLKNSSRLEGASSGAVGVAASRARFPDPGRRPPGAAVIVAGDDPAFALAAAALAAPPLNAALFALEPGDEALLQREVERLGVSRVYSFGGTTGTVLGAADPVEAAAQAVRVVAGERGTSPQRVILVDVSRADEMSPLIPWLALSGDALLFTTNGELPASAADALRQLGTIPTLYRGPGTPEVPQNTAQRIVALPDFGGARGAVSFAEFYDEAGGLGWDYNRDRRNGYHHYILALEDDWRSAFGASTLAPSNRTPLLWTGRDALSRVTEGYLWKVKQEFYEKPDEGPFYHTWIAGGLERIALGPQARSDLALEIGQYRTKGEAGASALELLMIGWMLLCLFSAAWIALHVLRRMPALHWTMKWGWPLLGLVAGPVGLWMYLKLYRRTPRTAMDMMGKPMGMWHRGRLGQVSAATAMGVSFDMPLMVVTAYLITLFGMPAIIFDGPLYWVGNSMAVMSWIAFIIPFALATLLYETPMQMMHRKVGFGDGLRHAWPPMLAAMAAGWLGMMGSMVWLHMVYPVGMEMPEEDQVRWWGFIAVAVLIGVFLEWLVNFWLVRTGRRPGSM